MLARHRDAAMGRRCVLRGDRPPRRCGGRAGRIRVGGYGWGGARRVPPPLPTGQSEPAPLPTWLLGRMVEAVADGDPLAEVRGTRKVDHRRAHQVLGVTTADT